MKKHFCLLLALLMLLSLCACAKTAPVTAEPEEPEETQEDSETPATPDEPEAPEEPAEPEPEAGFDPARAAETLAAQMGEGDFEACTASFNATLLAQADADYIAQLWASVSGSLGNYIAVDPVLTQTGSYADYTTAAAFCEFENGGLAVLTLYDADDLLDSLLFQYYTPQSQLQYDTVSDATPPLWKVSAPDGGTLYLFGSIHVADDTLFALPDAVMTAYEASDALAVEYDTFAANYDIASLMELQTTVLYQDGTTVADHLREDTYQMTVALLESKGQYSAALDSYTLAQWSSLITLLAAQEIGLSSDGVDSHLLNLAHHQGKPVLEVESQTMQLALLSSPSDLYQDASLRSSVEQFDESTALLQQMYTAYCAGDLEAIEALLAEDDFDDAALDAYTAEEQAAILAEADSYETQMYDARNQNMAAVALDYLAGGDTVFFVVGEAHMLGDTGLIALLTAAGCTVERVNY